MTMISENMSASSTASRDAIDPVPPPAPDPNATASSTHKMVDPYEKRRDKEEADDAKG